MTPLNYYGGKAQLADTIIPLLQDKSKCFVSLFTGGGAIEVGKKSHEVEIWNDTLSAIPNFWEVVKTPYLCFKLSKMLRRTLYSENNYRKACRIYKHFKGILPILAKDKLRLAWATFIMCNATYGHKILGGLGFNNTRNQAVTFRNKCKYFSPKNLVHRFDKVTIMNRPALELYRLVNKPNTIFYADPPYFNSDGGHYKGYTENDFEDLLKALSICKGKFVLSSYDSDILNKYIDEFGWECRKITMDLSMKTGVNVTKKIKTECITTNFNQSHALSETIPLF